MLALDSRDWRKNLVCRSKVDQFINSLEDGEGVCKKLYVRRSQTSTLNLKKKTNLQFAMNRKLKNRRDFRCFLTFLHESKKSFWISGRLQSLFLFLVGKRYWMKPNLGKSLSKISILWGGKVRRFSFLVSWTRNKILNFSYKEATFKANSKSIFVTYRLRPLSSRQ